MFVSVSALHINVAKSSIFIVGEGGSLMRKAALASGIGVENLPIHYLGLSSTTKSIANLNYESLLDRICK